MEPMSRKKSSPPAPPAEPETVAPVVEPGSVDVIIHADNLSFFTSTSNYTSEPLPTLILMWSKTQAPSMDLFNRLEALLIDYAEDEENPKDTQIVLTFLFDPLGDDKRVFKDKIGSGIHLESVSTAISFPKKQPAEFLKKIDETQKMLLIVSCPEWEGLAVINRESNDLDYQHIVSRRLH